MVSLGALLEASRMRGAVAVLTVLAALNGCGSAERSSQHVAERVVAQTTSELPGETEETGETGETARQLANATTVRESTESLVQAPPAVRIPLEAERAIDALVTRALARGDVPGAVVLIGRADGVVYRRAYGHRRVEPDVAPMTEDTVFDLASLTKPFTALTALRLARDRGVALDATVDAILPELAGAGITLRDLLTHRAGLRRVNPLGDYEGPRAERLHRTLAGARERARGGAPRYGDLHFIALGAWIERVEGARLDAVMRRTLLEPLQLGASFGPVRENVAESVRVASTERAPRRAEPGQPAPILHGEVDDPRAWRLDGVAGHAGLFARADDLGRLAETLLRDEGAELAPADRAAMRRCDQGRTLGWDCAGLVRDGFSAQAFAHGGYTGTWLVVDPTHDLYVVVLTNRVHPAGRGRVGGLRSAIARVALGARRDFAPAREAVLLGADRLRVAIEAGRSSLRGRRVALLTHDAGRARDGLPTSELLWRAHLEGQLVLARVFAPEHGLASDAEGHVADGSFRGIPLTSLFGARRRPSAEDLAAIDVIVVDVQDVGARFFTYASTVHEVLRAAAAQQVEVLVLDRPNPLGSTVDGPVLEPRYRSFVNHHPLPLRHGLSIGALSRRLVADEGLDVQLEVLEMQVGPLLGETRSWGATGLRWVPPSPNLPTPEAARLYLGVALVEGTNVSVGRGTDAPFARLGAPWMDPDALLASLPALEGLSVEATRFTPSARPYRGERCRGLAFSLDDVERFDPLALGEALVRALATTHPGAWDRARLPRMIGHDETLATWLGDAVVAPESAP